MPWERVTQNDNKYDNTRNYKASQTKGQDMRGGPESPKYIQQLNKERIRNEGSDTPTRNRNKDAAADKSAEFVNQHDSEMKTM